LLSIVTLIMLIKEKISLIEITLSAISIGWILDEITFIRMNLQENFAFYGQSFSAALIGGLAFVALIYLIIKFLKIKYEN